MSWTDPETKSTGNLITAAYWNQMLGPSGNQVLTAPGVFTTAGDIIYGTGDNATTRLASSGGGGKFLQMNGGATAPAWVTALTSLVADTTPQLGGFLDANGNYIQMQKGGDIASASPTVIDTDGDYFSVTGTTNFSAFTVAADRHFFLEFAGVLTITHGAGTIDLPGGANITTAAGDVGEFVSTAANVVTCVNYTKADGTAVVAASGGLTEADSWRLTTAFTGSAVPIASNLARVSTGGFGLLGTGMSESSGIFTFPSTGYWAVLALINFRYAGDSSMNQATIQVTVDYDNGAAWIDSSEGATADTQYDSETMRTSITLYTVVDVTDLANVKVRFRTAVADANVSTHGSTANQTTFNFLKLGDT